MDGGSRVLDITDHRRELGANRYVYPVISRRAGGLSVGVNLNPDKACNFACPYCQVDRTVPGADREVDLEVLAAELRELLGAAASGDLWEQPPFDTVPAPLRRVADVAFAGDGEPTACPVFAEAIEVAGRALADAGLAAVRPVVLTNATLLHRPAVQRGLAALDRLDGRVWAKLDAGTEPFYRWVDGTSVPFGRVLRNLRDCSLERPIVLQCMFHLWNGRPPPAAERDAWAGRIRDILAAGGRIEEVQVVTVARRPAHPAVAPLGRPDLEDIAGRVRALGLPVRIAEGPEQWPPPRRDG